MNLTFITSNKNKCKEFSYILQNSAQINCIDIELDEIQGDPYSIAIDKCNRAYDLLKSPIIVEDTSLIFNAFNGLPGPYIKDFYQKIGNDGLYKMIENFDDKSAISLCIIAYKKSSKDDVICFIGRTDGVIVEPSNDSSNGFGWDNIFKTEINIDGNIEFKRLSEMTIDEKNSISSRKKAITKLKEYLLST